MGLVRIVYSYKLRELAGNPQEMLEVPTPILLGDLLRTLGSRHGAKFIREMNLTSFELGEKCDFYLIFVDGKRIWGNEKEIFSVKEKSEIKFLPLMSGG